MEPVKKIGSLSLGLWGQSLEYTITLGLSVVSQANDPYGEAGPRPLIQLVSWGQNRNKNTSKYSHDSSYNLPFTLKTWFVREMIKLRLGNKSFYLSMKFMIIQIGTFL